MENYWIKEEWLDIEEGDEVRDMLYKLATREHRAPTPHERCWMCMLRACPQDYRPRRDYAMAAASDGFNERIERAASDTEKFDFFTAGDAYRVSIARTELSDREPEVNVRMVDRKGDGVPHGRVLFPGAEFCIELDDDGWGNIPYSDYARCIRAVMRLQCSTPSGEPMELMMK